jgi:plastocyanin
MARTIGSHFARGVAAIALVALIAFAPGATVRAQDTSVSIVDNAFGSTSITVEAGSTVTWTNNGSNNHTVTADDGSFGSGTLGSGGSYSFTFNSPGTYAYHCEIHPSMTAQVVVVAAAADTGDDDMGDDSADTGDTGGTTTVPSTGVGSTASQGAPAALLVLALVLAGSAAVVRRWQVAK